MTTWTPIYVDNKLRHAVPRHPRDDVFDGYFFVASEEFPHVRCGEHWLSSTGTATLKNNCTVFTNGHKYSLTGRPCIRPTA